LALTQNCFAPPKALGIPENILTGVDAQNTLSVPSKNRNN
jgi:hypothetical protein